MSKNLSDFRGKCDRRGLEIWERIRDIGDYLVPAGDTMRKLRRERVRKASSFFLKSK